MAIAGLMATSVGCGESDSVPRVDVPASVTFVPGRSLEFMLLDGSTEQAQHDLACRLGATLNGRGHLVAVFRVVGPEAGGFVQQDGAMRRGETVVVVDWASLEARVAVRGEGAYASALTASDAEITISASLATVPPQDSVPPPPFSYTFTFDPERGYELGSGDPVAPPSQQFIDEVLVLAASEYGRRDVFAAPDVVAEGAEYVKGLTNLVEWSSRERFVSFVTDPSSPLGQHLDAREAFVPASTLELFAIEYVAAPCPGRDL